MPNSLCNLSKFRKLPGMLWSEQKPRCSVRMRKWLRLDQRQLLIMWRLVCDVLSFIEQLWHLRRSEQAIKPTTVHMSHRLLWHGCCGLRAMPAALFCLHWWLKLPDMYRLAPKRFTDLQLRYRLRRYQRHLHKMRAQLLRLLCADRYLPELCREESITRRSKVPVQRLFLRRRNPRGLCIYKLQYILNPAKPKAHFRINS